APAPYVADRMSASLAAWLKYLGDFDEARRLFEESYRAAIDERDESSLPYIVGHLPQLELWTGNWDAAERAAREHLELSEQMAQPEQRRQALFNLALVHAHRGASDEAQAEATELQQEAEDADDSWGLANAFAVLGRLALSRGDAREAADLLRRNVE